MTRASAVALAALALAAPACGGKKAAPTAGVNLRTPSSAAFYAGYSSAAPSSVRAYVAISNAGRNDLSILDGKNDLPVPAPILLRGLEVPVPDRPALLVATRLFDVDDIPQDPYTGDPGSKKPDLLVAVSAGSSVLQLVQTWNQVNAIDGPGTVDLVAIGGDDVLAVVAVPTGVPGTARLAAALANRKLAVVDYVRGVGGSIVRTATTVHSLPFQPVALAAMPEDPGHVYAASLEEISPGVFGVGEVAIADGSVRALDARAPTRLVAAARLRERKTTATEADPQAFGCDPSGTCSGSAQPVVPRVYAVLDEASCGHSRRIDCGVVVLDPSTNPVPGRGNIPADWDGAMPYRAPLRLSSRPLAFAAAQPPLFPPTQGAIYAGSFMRIYTGDPVPAAVAYTLREEATTGVAALPGADGNTAFLDLGRSRAANIQSPLAVTKAVPVQPLYVNNLRLWIQNPASGAFAGTENATSPETNAAKYMTVTPGWTPDESWSVTYQGRLPGLDTRHAEVGSGGGALWLAIQRSAPGATPIPFTEVARLWDPALGVHTGDLVVVTARSVGGSCVGTVPPGTAANVDPSTIVKQVELRVAALLPPETGHTPSLYPGGAVQLAPPADSDPQEWKDCYAALGGNVAQSTIATLPEVTLRTSGLVLEGTLVGYAGRPSLGQPYVLRYPTNPAPGVDGLTTDEDALALQCPVADWQGPPAAAPACDATCRTACETLVLARKVRRYDLVAENCGTPTGASGDPIQACLDTWSVPLGTGGTPMNQSFPLARGPALVFQVDVQANPTAVPAPTVAPARDMVVRFSSTALSPQVVRPVGAAPIDANGIVAFDRSPYDPTAGYCFIVPYSTDAAMDTSPATTPVAQYVIR